MAVIGYWLIVVRAIVQGDFDASTTIERLYAYIDSPIDFSPGCYHDKQIGREVTRFHCLNGLRHGVLHHPKSYISSSLTTNR